MERDIVLLARQPIFDRHLNIVGYELLFRPDARQPATLNGDQTTSQVIFNALTGTTFDELVGPHRAFINFTDNLLQAPPPLPAQRCVIEILEDVKPSDTVLQQLKHLKRAGYTLALDDFHYQTDYDPLLEVVDIVKLDVLALSPSQLQEHVQHLRRYPLKILAEKVETRRMFQQCLALGCDYFQGFFLAHPELVKGNPLTSNRLVVLNLLQRLHDPSIDFSELEALIAQDTAMSYQLLRLVNSTSNYRPQRSVKITSLRQAIMLLGLKQLRRWCSLLALTRLHDKPNALFLECLFRAKLCEAIGEQLMPSHSAQFFTVGLFSMLDAIFDQPLEILLSSIALEDAMTQALLHQRGVLGLALQTAIAYEEAHWSAIPWGALQQLGITEQDLAVAYQDCLHWINELESLLPPARTQ